MLSIAESESHDKELNGKDDEDMILEAEVDAEATTAEAGDESVYHHSRSLTPHIAFVTFSLSP